MSEVKTTTFSSEEIEVFQSYKTWTNLLAIFSYITAGLLIFITLIFTVLTFGFGLLIFGPTYGPLIWVSIWSGNKLKKSSQKAGEITTETTLEEYKEKSFAFISEIKTYFKIQGIVTIVSFVLSLVVVIFYIAFFGLIASSFSSGDFQLESGNRPSSITQDLPPSLR